MLGIIGQSKGERPATDVVLRVGVRDLESLEIHGGKLKEHHKSIPNLPNRS